MTTPRQDKQLKSAVEAAEVLGVSRQRIHQLVNERKLTGMRDRSFLYVRRDEVMALQATRGKRAAIPSGWMTKDQVADRFGVAPRTVNDWHLNGWLRGSLTASRLLFPVDAVEKFTPPPRGRPPTSA